MSRSLYGIPLVNWTVEELTNEINRLDTFIQKHSPTVNRAYHDRLALLKTIRSNKIGKD